MQNKEEFILVGIMQKKVNKAIYKIRFCIFCQVCKNFLIWQSASAFQCSGAIKKLFFFMSQITGMAIFAFLLLPWLMFVQSLYSELLWK